MTLIAYIALVALVALVALIANKHIYRICADSADNTIYTKK